MFEAMMVTLQMVADRLGVHVTTVSKALRGNPAIARATRERVERTAKEMGYVPDPRLRALADYREAKRGRAYQASLAWVHCHGKTEPMERFPAYGDYWKGAQERAGSLGYSLDRYWVPEGETGMARLLRTLEARGVPGLVLAPLAQPGVLRDLDWSPFSVVTIGFTLREPGFHRVSVDHYRLMRTLIDQLTAEGARRIGCYLNAEEQERVERRMAAAARMHVMGDSIRVKLYERPDRRSFMAWLGRHRFDAVISGCRELPEWLAGTRRAVKVVDYAYDAGRSVVSGMYHNNRRIGEEAVALLDSMVRRAERGVPEESVELLVEARWIGASGKGSPTSA